MGRLTNKERFTKSVFQDIEHTTDPELQQVYICLLKEKLDAINYDYKSLLYNEVKSIAEGIFDIMQQLNIDDKNHTLVMENIKSVLQQKYWSMYMNKLQQEELLYERFNYDQ